MLQKDGDRWFVTVDAGDGHPQTFYGNTQDEVLAELVKAQTHATKTIREQKRLLKTGGAPVDPGTNVPEFKPRELSVDERFQLTQRLNDPSQGPEAVRAIVEAALGAPLETVRATLDGATQDRETARCLGESNTFISQHPEFKLCQENESAMNEYLSTHRMAYTAHNLALAYQDLKDVLILNVPSVTRPRSANSTGAPARSSARPTAPAPKKLTAEEIHKMSSEEYTRKMQDPAFRKLVDESFASASRA